jgi:hypothetical protein
VPCYRCHARQSDPVKGPSPWKRGVVGGEQVLVCPDCQRGRDWQSDLDRCDECGSAQLVRVLGDTRCKACGHVTTDVVPDRGSEPAGTTSEPLDQALAADVSDALARRFGSYPDSAVP